MCDKHLHLSLISLIREAPHLVDNDVLKQLFQLVSNIVDSSMVTMDQQKILVALDMTVTLSEHTRHSVITEYQPKTE